MISKKHLSLLCLTTLSFDLSLHAGQGLKALTRVAPQMAAQLTAPAKNALKHRPPMIKNDMGITCAVVGGIAAIIGIITCACQPESDQKVLNDAEATLQSASRSIAMIGGQQNINQSIVFDNLGEEQLAGYAQQMNVVTWPAYVHRNDIDIAIRNLTQHSVDLKGRIHQKSNNPQEHRICSTMQTMVNQIDRTITILQNRYQLIQTHETYFNLYRVEMITSNHFNTLLFSPNIEHKNLRAFANGSFETAQFPYLAFIEQLKNDINECAKALGSYNLQAYPNKRLRVTTIKEKLEEFKTKAFESKDYQDAREAKKQFEIEQQKIAQKEAELALKARQTRAQEEQAEAARQAAAAQTVSAAAQTVQAAAAIETAKAKTVAANAQALRLSLALDAQEAQVANHRPPPYAN